MKRANLIAACFALVVLAAFLVPRIDWRGPHIAPVQLTADQRDVVDLLFIPGGQNILFFEYHLDETFDSREVWVEVFHYGELIATPVRWQVSGLRDWPHRNGTFAIAIPPLMAHIYQWTIFTTGGRHDGEPWAGAADHSVQIFAPITRPVAIEDGREIVLYTHVFSDSRVYATTSDALSSGCQQVFRERPELLAQYTYVHMIVASFSS